VRFVKGKTSCLLIEDELRISIPLKGLSEDLQIIALKITQEVSIKVSEPSALQSLSSDDDQCQKAIKDTKLASSKANLHCVRSLVLLRYIYPRVSKPDTSSLLEHRPAWGMVWEP
jgi:hypothetical protein